VKSYKLEIDDVKRRNSVNAGLLTAAHDLESFTTAKKLSDERYKKALAAFTARYTP
jgi:hypothetical protein